MEERGIQGTAVVSPECGPCSLPLVGHGPRETSTGSVHLVTGYRGADRGAAELPDGAVAYLPGRVRAATPATLRQRTPRGQSNDQVSQLLGW